MLERSIAPDSPTRRDWQRCVLVLTLLGLIVSLYLMRLRMLETLVIDPDEFEHLHVAWCMAKGLVPYRDFFEHHTPWLYFLIQPFIRFYATDTNPNDAVAFIFFARRMAMVLAGVGIALTFMIGRRWRGESVAWISAALLSTVIVFVRKTLEVRPDGLAMVLWLGALAALIKALEDRAPTRRSESALFALSGFLLGGAIMSTQKFLVIMPAISIAMIWYLCAGASGLRRRSFNILWQFGGFSAAIGVTLAYFWAHGAVRVFIEDNLMLNLEWKTWFPRYEFMFGRFSENPVLATLGAIGILREIPTTFRTLNFTADKLLFLATAGAIAGLFTLPEPWPQYYLMFVPLLSLYAAALLTFIAKRIAGSDENPSRPGRKIAYALALGLVSSGAIALSSIAVPIWVPLAFAAFLLSGIIVLFRAPGAGLAILLVAFSIHPWQQMEVRFNAIDNSSQLSGLRYVLTSTRPTDTVLDGWSGLGVFRPHAYFYFFVHGGIMQFISAQDRQQLYDGLLSGRIAPTLVIPSGTLLELSPKVDEIFSLDYEPVSRKILILRRKAEPLSGLLRKLQAPSAAPPGSKP